MEALAETLAVTHLREETRVSFITSSLPIKYDRTGDGRTEQCSYLERVDGVRRLRDFMA